MASWVIYEIQGGGARPYAFVPEAADEPAALAPLRRPPEGCLVACESHTVPSADLLTAQYRSRLRSTGRWGAEPSPWS